MKLAELISQETAAPDEAIMLLRHSNGNVAKLRRYGEMIEEYTAIQPIGSKWDYCDPSKTSISVVVVVVDDRVYAVFRVLGVDAEGTSFELGSEAFQRFDAARNNPPRSCRRFSLQRLSSIAIGQPVQGWEGSRTRTSVQRSNGRFFNEIRISLASPELTQEELEASFRKHVEASMRDSPLERQRRLDQSSDTPSRVKVSSFAYVRNPDVVAEVLLQANGVCQGCGSPAPFQRRSDGTPYLEVHHKIRLAEGGKDLVANAIALCPNCHRESHYA